MPLADSLTFINRDNFFAMSLIIGIIVGIIPGIGVLGPIVGGFLYAYFSMFYGQIPKDQMEAIKRGAYMGLILSIISVVITLLIWSSFVPAHPMMFPMVTFSALAIINLIIVGLIIGAILGGIGGFIAYYVE